MFTEWNQIFWNDFVCLHSHICKISSQIIDLIIFAPYELYNNIYSMHGTALYWDWGNCRSNGPTGSDGHCP